MGRRPKQSALEAFELNMEDADILLKLAKALTNERTYRMRREKRERVGSALAIGKKQWDDLDCIESDDFFMVLKPDASVCRQDLEDIRPLLRQAIVAACSSVEIDQRYQRKRWGLRQVIEEHDRIEASAERMKIGVLFSTAGVPQIWSKVNGRAGKKLDTELDQIVDRRNRIAHQGDRRGGGRAALAFEDVEDALKLIRDLIEYLDVESKGA